MNRTETTEFNPGNLLNSWEAHDYHPHNRGLCWYLVFGLIMFGVVLWAIMTDPQWGWFTALAFLFVVGMYSYVHKNGHEVHQVALFEHGMFVDQQFVSWDVIEGYWFVYDETVSVVHFQKKGKNDTKINLQMGEQTPDFFRSSLAKAGLTELVEKSEGLVDLWVRVLKL